MHSRRAFQILVWISAGVLWFAALGMVWVSVNKTQMGYQIHELLEENNELTEQNLRYRSEIAALYDLSNAEIYAKSRGFHPYDPDTEIVISGGSDQ